MTRHRPRSFREIGREEVSGGRNEGRKEGKKEGKEREKKREKKALMMVSER